MIDRRRGHFSFPTVGHHDVLRGLDHLRGAGVAPDQRVAEAVERVLTRRHRNGRWPLGRRHHDRLLLEMEIGPGKASRWNRLRALRVLDRYGDHA